MEYPLPPILRIKGLRIIAMGTDDKGTFFKFAATRNRVREVTVHMMAPGAIRWEYTYAIYDPDTKTVTTYQGVHGDPTKDRTIDMRGV